MMNRDQLVHRRGEAWRRLEALLQQSEGRLGVQSLGPQGIAELAQLYRGIASDLMRVRRDKLGADIERLLDNLASRAHNTLYAGSWAGSRTPLIALLLDFPGAVRRNAGFFWLAFLLFYGPLFLAGFAAYLDEAYALTVLSPGTIEQFEQMYAKGHAEGREANLDAQMTGFYVFNNIGIAFRCFATGIVAGLGPIYFSIFNGLNIGATFGHLIRVGHGENILSFGATHGPWELNAIVISAAAGLQMGWALVVSRGRTRAGNLVAHGLELLRQVAGAAAFLALAAVLEGWYSPSSLPPDVKYASGLLGCVLVTLILVFAGRQRPVPEDVLQLRRGL